MSVTIAVPGIPTGESVSYGDPETQDGGLISPVVSVMRIGVAMSGGDVAAIFNLADYGISRALIFGANFRTGGYYSIDVDSTLYNPPFHYRLQCGDFGDILYLDFTDGPTVDIEVWCLGVRLQPHD
jgi:hypothetical protein